MKTARQKIDEMLERYADQLPHPKDLTTPKGYTPYGKMVTPAVRVMLYAAIMFPAFTRRMIALLNPASLQPDEYAVYEAIVVTTEDGSDPDVVKVFRYTQSNYPSCKYKVTGQLLLEADMWNLHDEVVEQVIRQYRTA